MKFQEHLSEAALLVFCRVKKGCFWQENRGERRLIGLAEAGEIAAIYIVEAAESIQSDNFKI